MTDVADKTTYSGPAPDVMDGVDLDTWGFGTNNATGITNNKLGMWLFLGSDCLLFGALISTYLLLRHRGTGLRGEDVFDIPFTSVSSFVLLMSSVSMVFAVCSAAPSSPGRSTSSRRSTAKAWATPPPSSRRLSTLSPASTASTSRSASSC